MKLVIINGPNLNLLGKREPEIYGHIDFETFFKTLALAHPTINFEYYQSNVEGELINALHQWGFSANGILLNAGGFTHTSIALADAVAAVKTPVVEVHLSNIFARENFRHTSYIGAHCVGSISGFGLQSYALAVSYFTNMA